MQRRQLPVRRGTSRPEYLLGLVTEDNAVESRAGLELHFGDADTMAAANECDYYVEWEHDSGGEWVSLIDIERMLVPVSQRTGRPVVVRVTDENDARFGEMAMIMVAFPKSYELRFIAERTDDPAVLSRELVRRNHFLTGAHETCRFEFYDVSALPIHGDMRVADVVFDLFMDAARQRVLAEHPDCAADVALLADSAALAGGAGASFHGRRVMMTFTDRETGMDRLYGGVVESSSRSAQGRVLFHLRFDAEFEGDSGDTVTLDAAELVDAIAWRHVPSSPRVTASGAREWGSRSPRRSRPRYSRQRGSAALTPDAKVADGGPGHSTTGPASRALFKSPDPTTTGGRSAASGRGDAAAAMRAIWAAGGDSAAARPPAGASPARRARASVARHAAVSRRGQASRSSSTREMRNMVLEGQDYRLTEEYLAAHPRRDRSLPSISSWLDKHHGKVSTTAGRRRRKAWRKPSAGECDSWLRLTRRMKSVKASTLRSYSSTCRSYEAHCQSFTPPLNPYPLTADVVGVWLVRRYSEEGLLSNISNTKPLISALTHFARTELRLDLDVRPYPGMDAVERAELHRICVALAEMEDIAARRSIPLTALLLRMMIDGRDMPTWHDGITADELRLVRDVARYGLNRVCMLRRDDCRGDKQMAAMYRSEDGYAGRLLVEPGKAHRTAVWAEVPGLDGEPAGDWTDWVQAPGYAMHEWLKCLRHLHGGAVPPTAHLFPELTDEGTPLDRAASADEFQALLRRWARDAGLPESFTERITLHGFRSGGCSDAVNSGRLSIQEIMRQGRWTSHCFEMYIHMHAGIVRENFRKATCDAALTVTERGAAKEAEDKQRALLFWRDSSLAAMRGERTSP